MPNDVLIRVFVGFVFASASAAFAFGDGIRKRAESIAAGREGAAALRERRRHGEDIMTERGFHIE